MNKDTGQLDLFKDNMNAVFLYFNLFKSGNYLMSKEKNLNAKYCIPIKYCHKNGFLIYCYKSGYVNKTPVNELLEAEVNKVYRDGVNDNSELSEIEIIENECIVGLHIIQDEENLFKCHFTENIPINNQLNSQGTKLIYNDFKNIEFHFLSIAYKDKIRKLIFDDFTNIGISIDNEDFRKELIKVRKLTKSINKITKQLNLVRFKPKKITHDCVGKKAIVEIKYLEINKEITVKIVDKPVKTIEKINGIQNINLSTVLAVSLQGRRVGDKLYLDASNHTIQIMSIRNFR